MFINCSRNKGVIISPIPSAALSFHAIHQLLFHAVPQAD